MLSLTSRRFLATITIHCFIPILAGAMVYLLWRTDTLLVFAWIDFIGLGEVISIFRLHSAPILPWIPEVFLYSFPDACWTYAFAASMLLVWNTSISRLRWPWILSGFFMAVTAEFGQVLGLVPGTFQWWDVLAYTLSTTFAICLLGGHPCRSE